MSEPAFTLDAPLVGKILGLIDQGLVQGVGRPRPGEMCVEAVICYALGQEHGDQPTCVAPAVRQFKIKLNDACWSSELARAKGLRRVAIAQLGSAVVIDEKRFVAIVAEQTIRQIVPIALRAAAERVPVHRESLLTAALRCETEGTKEAAENARVLARKAAAASADAAASASAAAAASASAAAADAAAYAAYAACAAYAASAASADASASASAAAADAAADAKGDAVLALAAEIAVEALRECGSPGVAFMPEAI